ncbi:MAG: hypothetical protein FJ319_08480 [SAR202 cluster bacterium]|nr:hypothetical protein [SAR202 cluster bacterium]
MDLIFDRGDKDHPRGHALLYFRSTANAQEVWATYIVILPVTLDVSKYVPPFLMNQMGAISPKELSAFAFPPAPEKLDSYSVVERLAELRNDDVILAGTLSPLDIPSAMMKVSEIVQVYGEMYGRYAGAAPGGESTPEMLKSGESTPADLGVNDVMYSLMSESDRLGELTKLVGRLRFAVEGSDASGIKEAEGEINVLARHLPSSHNVGHIVKSAKLKDSRGAKLAEYYLQRCFHLSREEYAQLAQVESRIKELEG